MNAVQLILGIGMVASGFTLARYALKDTNIGRGVLQLIAGIVLMAGGIYMAIKVI